MNHHGRVRKLGDDQTEDEDNVLRNNWVGGNEQLQLDLISRKEDVQVFAFNFMIEGSHELENILFFNICILAMSYTNGYIIPKQTMKKKAPTFYRLLL